MKKLNQKPDPRDTKNLTVAIVLSVLVIFAWNMFVDKPHREKQLAEQNLQKTMQAEQTLPAAEEGKDAVRARGDVLGEQKTSRVVISTPSLHGSINLRGARLDDLTLAHYRETVDDASPEIALLNPVGTEAPYYAEFGWQNAEGSSAALPTRDTLWQADGDTLTPEKPIKLTTQIGDLLFTRTLAVDADYMFSVTDRVENKGAAAVSLYAYGRVLRTTDLKHAGLYILHEGPLGVYNKKLAEDSYKDLIKGPSVVSRTTKGGWFGFTDKYWLVAMALPAEQSVNTRVLHASTLGDNRFQSDFTAEAQELAPGASAVQTLNLFAGAKEVRLLDAYQKNLGLPLFDRAIDFGWYYIITKPFFYALDILGRFLGNFGLGILAFTVMVKAALFPLARHSFVSMSKMKLVAPKMTELREKYREDPQTLSKEMMELYKREKINPVSGCWPILIQIPIFFSLYKVLYVTIEMRHAPFFGWVHDLSAMDPTSLLNLFGLLPFTAPHFLHIGIWPILMGVSMFLQMKMNPPPTDETQRMVFMIMPFMLTFMMGSFPAGLVIYWTWSNTLTIIQQYFIMRKMHVKVFSE